MSKTEQLINKVLKACNLLSKENDTEILQIVCVEVVGKIIIGVPYCLWKGETPYIRVVDYGCDFSHTGWYSLEEFKELANKYNLEEKEL